MWSDDDLDLQRASIEAVTKDSLDYAIAKKKRDTWKYSSVSKRATSMARTYDSTDDDDGDELEVLPPSDSRQQRKGPRLSITGEKAADAIELVDGEDSIVEGNASLPDSRRGSASISRELHFSSDDDDIDIENSKPRNNLRPIQTSVACEVEKPTARATTTYDWSSDSDDSMMELNRRIEALRNKAKPAPLSRSASKPKKRKDTTTKFKPEIPKRSKVDKAAEKQKAKDVRTKAQALKAAEKQRAKEERTRAREEQKAAKRAANEKAKAEKHQKFVAINQARGKYSHMEVICLIDAKWLDDDKTQEKVKTEMAESGGYMWHPFTHLLNCRAVQWIRKDFVDGGGADARQQLLAGNHSGYQHIPLLAILVEGSEFLDLLMKDFKEQDDDYPELQRWLRGIQESYQIAWKAKTQTAPRILILLERVKEELDKMWKKYNRAKRNDEAGCQPPTEEELQDSIIWILIEFQVEAIFCSSKEEVAHELSKMTRILGEEPYEQQVTELECIRKLKSQTDPNASDLERARDVWFRQIQQIPRVSHTMARYFTQFYPTAVSLWEAYQDEKYSEEDRHMLVANCFSAQRTHTKLSCWMCMVMTSNDPSDMLI